MFPDEHNGKPGSCSFWAMETGSACGRTVPCGFVVMTSGPTKRVWRKWARFWQAYNAAHIVVGHTVQRSGRIRPRFGDKVFLIDTGMLSSYYPGGRASALEICGDSKFTAKYMDQQVMLIDSAVSSPDKAQVPGSCRS